MQDFHRSSILYCAFSSHRLRGAPSLSGDGRFGARSLLAQLQAHSQVAGHGQPAPGAPQRLQGPLLGGGPALGQWLWLWQQQLGQRRRRRQQPLRQNTHRGELCSLILYAHIYRILQRKPCLALDLEHEFSFVLSASSRVVDHNPFTCCFYALSILCFSNRVLH